MSNWKLQLKAELELLQNKLGAGATDFEDEIQLLYCGTIRVTKLGGGEPLSSHWIKASQKERDEILAEEKRKWLAENSGRK